MYKLINFAINLMEKQNQFNPELLPSQNPNINPTQNPEINPDQNPNINSSQNPDINYTQNPDWKKNQWNLFKETIIWENLNENFNEAYDNIKQFIEDVYNAKRLHSSIGYVPPNEFEAEALNIC